jgi:hypothetical protein
MLMRRQKKFILLLLTLCRGPSRRAGVVMKKTRIYQMILKNIWLFPIAYCDVVEHWQLGFQDVATKAFGWIFK